MKSRAMGLLVGLSEGEGGRELGVGAWAGLGVGVGLNNRGEELLQANCNYITTAE